VYLETGESPEEISRRKVDQDWTNGGKFKCKDSSGTSESGDGTSSSSEGSDEFTLNEETSSQLHQGTLDMKYVRRFVEVCVIISKAALDVLVFHIFFFHSVHPSNLSWSILYL